METDPDRRAVVERLSHEALTRPAGERLAFLRDTCAGDETLLREVESLLARLASTSGSAMTGRRVGVYQLHELLGAGGMGEVYRARDTKLGREVAIKFLPPAFTSDPDRLARFEREARTLAMLNHPHIGAIYGFEESDSSPGSGQAAVRGLVLELVEGQTLAERIARGALPIAEALTIARQIADALDAAHEKGIVHRDLKPPNIKITPAGVAKVLDFGLAKLDARGAFDAEAFSRLPTMAIGGTREGVIVGTAVYMSPEQARGKPVDKRTDIWAFGCVLFEMLTGRLAFAGETVSDTVAAILEREPEWQVLPDTTSVTVRRLLQRCLEKDSRQRLRDIGDVRLELDHALALNVRPPEAPAPRQTRLRSAVYAVMYVLAGAAIAGVLAWNLWRTPQTQVANFTIKLGANEFLPRPGGLAFSPDGTLLAYLVARGEQRQLYLRRTAEPGEKAIPGTEGATGVPVFSPDGQWLAFWQNAKWKKVALTGGPPLPMFDSPPGGAVMAAWGPDDTLVFGITPASLVRVSASGGALQNLTVIDPRKMERFGGEPQFLPDGKTVLFGMRTSDVDAFNDYRIAAYSFETMQRKILVEGGTKATYLPSGHLVYLRAGTLLAAPFDLAELSVTGPAVPVLGDVYENAVDGTAQFAISANGSLAYAPGGEVAGARRVVWVDRQGNEEPLPLPPRSYLHPRISPDGRQIVIEVEGPNHDVFLYDLARGSLTKVTFDGSSHSPLWTEDGKRITFRAGMPDPFTMWWMPTDRSGPAERLATTGGTQVGVTPPGPMPQGAGSMASGSMPQGAGSVASGSMPQGAGSMSSGSMPQGAGSMSSGSMPQSTGSMPPSATGGMSGAVQQGADAWSPDGRTLAFTQVNPETGGDIFVFEMGEGKTRPFAQTKFDEGAPRFSPDGRWISYSSNESGQNEIYVQEFPGPGPKIQISTAGGTDATWKRTGGELYYRTGDRMMVIAVVTRPAFTAGKPSVLFEGHYNLGQNSMCGPPSPSSSNYDVTADGQRFLMVKEGERDVPPTEIRVVPNWSEEVKRLVESKKN